ncbi:MAG TPA: iron-sulfur cluster assembly accessory protein [Candidatus Binatia bacterium]|jgi:iron-sulfur cluster assembly protein
MDSEIDHDALQKETLSLTLTEKAIQQVKTLLARNHREGQGLRVSVTDGGCSGFSYKLDFAKEEQPGDLVLELDHVKVYVDAKSVPQLKGTTIDYVTSLYGGGFKFSNPNASGTCGCGTSFSA